MKRKNLSLSYVILAFALFIWVNLPKHISDEMRSFTVASLAPTWKWAKDVKEYLADRPDQFWTKEKKNDSAETLSLQLENQILRSQMKKVAQWLESEACIQNQMKMMSDLSQEKDKSREIRWRDFFQKRASHLKDLLQYELMSMPAQVIYRDPASWSSSLWINVGKEDNRILGRTVIEKNSPVVSGITVIGVIDHVGRKQSRVRLITDSGLTPSVRAIRGASQKREIAALADALLEKLRDFETRFEITSLVNGLKALNHALGESLEENYLAKGEIHGSSAPFWRSRKPLLKGVGFHFDSAESEKVEMIKKGDLLVTTGLDGVFPPDLLVGEVSKVGPMKTGGYAFEIEARPAMADFNHLQMLFVLPPRND